MEKQCDGKSQSQLAGNGSNGVDSRVGGALPECIVIQQIYVVGNPGEIRLGTDFLVGETIVDSPGYREYHADDEE